MTPRAEMEAALEAILFVSSEPIPRARLLEIFGDEEQEQAAEALETVLARYRDTPVDADPAPPAEMPAETPAETAAETEPAEADDGSEEAEPAAEAEAEGEGAEEPKAGLQPELPPAATEPAAATLSRSERGFGVMVDEVAGGVRLVTRPELGGWLRRFFEVRGSTKLSMAALETLAIIAYRQPITAPEIQELRGVNSSGVIKTLLERRLARIAGRKQVVGNPFLYRTTKEFLVHFGLGRLKELPPLEEFEETFGLAIDSAAPAAVEADREEEILKEAAALEEAG